MKNQLQKLCFTALLLISFCAISFCQVPKLNSLPAALPTIFLDFDGEYVNSVGWNNGDPFTCGAANISTAQIAEIFSRVSEDYRPFAVNITTDSTKFLAAPVDRRIRIIVTDSSAWYPQAVAGITYTGSFTWGNDIPGFVFSGKLNNSTKKIAECCSHESGHAVGLSHQSKYDQCTLLERYNSGIGTGETSWAPIMGNSYDRNMTGWSNGNTESSCNTQQDNLFIISSQNGFTYRTDDYTELLDNTTTTLNSNSFNVTGIITTPTDKDAFKITLTQSGAVHIAATPFNVGANDLGANLDIMVELYNSSSTLIRTYNPIATMSLAIDTVLPSGTYFLKASGAGNGNTSNYGSLGSYTLTGNTGILAIHSVVLKANKNGNIHELAWSVIADEQIAKQVLEISTDAINFKPIMTDITGIKSYNYKPSTTGNIYYRLKVTSVIAETMYSNIVKLNTDGNDKFFIVSNLVQQNIYINALENFNFKIFDANARLITSGKKEQGLVSIDASNFSNGLYVLQIMSKGNVQNERIIKQ